MDRDSPIADLPRITFLYPIMLCILTYIPCEVGNAFLTDYFLDLGTLIFVLRFLNLAQLENGAVFARAKVAIILENSKGEYTLSKACLFICPAPQYVLYAMNVLSLRWFLAFSNRIVSLGCVLSHTLFFPPSLQRLKAPTRFALPM